MLDASDLNHCKVLSCTVSLLRPIAGAEEGQHDGSGGQFDTQTIMDPR